MTKESSTVGSHLSVAMTTTETDESTTGGDTVTSSSSREGRRHFLFSVRSLGHRNCRNSSQRARHLRYGCVETAQETLADIQPERVRSLQLFVPRYSLHAEAV